MRVFAISDLHLDETNSKPMNIFDDVWTGYKDEILKSAKALKLKSDDVLIVAGDISWAMALKDALIDIDFLSKFPCRVLILRGNHDYWWGSISAVREALPENVHAIQNDAIKIGKYIFCGTRLWNPPEAGKKQKADDEKIYKREVIRLDLSIKAAQKLQTENEQIVLITHYPPFNNKMEENNEVLRMIKDAGIKIVIFGHLHGKHHNYKAITEMDGIKYYLTSCDFLKNQIMQII